MENIGCVIYTETNNCITAEWVYSKRGKIDKGNGIGIRSTNSKSNKKFEGEYDIIYTDIKGNYSPKLKLIILFESGYYRLNWMRNKAIIDVGIGFENENKLIAVWSEFKEDLNLL